MRDAREVRHWRPTRVDLAAGGLVVAGFLLKEIHWGFIVLVGFGTFGIRV